MGGEISWSLVVSVASLVLVILSSVGGLVWKLSRIEIGLRAEAAAEVAEIRAHQAQEYAALSAKLYQVEIWSRDEFVRKGSFETVITRMEKGFGDLRSEISGRLDRLTERLGVSH